jgi:hypothetical protein
LKGFSVERVLNSEAFKPYWPVLEKLKPVVNNPVIFKFDSYFYKSFSVFEERPEDHSIYDAPGYSGSINLSNSVSIDNLGCYYFAINCGNHCSQGFIVIAEFQDERWKVKELVQIWRG